MDLTLPDNTLVVMVKRDMKFFIPRGKTILKTGDKLLVITDNDEELLHTYQELGIHDYRFEKTYEKILPFRCIHIRPAFYFMQQP